MADKQDALSAKDGKGIDSTDWVKVPGWLSQGGMQDAFTIMDLIA